VRCSRSFDTYEPLLKSLRAAVDIAVDNFVDKSTGCGVGGLSSATRYPADAGTRVVFVLFNGSVSRETWPSSSN
jgi:hypothetical protein